MKEQKRNNVIFAVCLMALILAAIVGVLFSTNQQSTVASAEAAVDCVSNDVNGNNDDSGISVFALKCTNHMLMIVSVESTCTTEGYEGYQCPNCGVLTKSQEFLPLGHDYSVHVETVNSTCMTYGHTTYKCSRCDSTKTTDLMTTEHQIIERETPATCNQGGKIETYCTVCGEVFETIETEPTYDHVRGRTEITGTSCTLPGTEYVYCAECGEIYMYGDIPELGHDFSIEVERVEKCTELGYVTYKCTRCDETNTEILYDSGHNYVLLGKPHPATCTSCAYKVYMCNRCNLSSYKEEEGVPLGHDYSIETEYHEADCEHNEIAIYECTRCGDTIDKSKTKALGHDISQRKILEATGEYPAIYERYCTRCGEVFGTVTGEQIYDEGNQGGDQDNNQGNNQGGDQDTENPAPAPKVNAVKILKMCLFFTYVWIAFGLCLLCFIKFIKRLKL